MGETLSRGDSLMCDYVLPPTNFRVTGKGTSYIELAWKEPNNGKCPTHYLVLYQEIGARKLDWTPCHAVIGTRHRLEGLKGSTEYLIAIYSVCDRMLSEECKLLFDKTETSFMKSALTAVGVMTAALGVEMAIIATGGLAAVGLGSLIADLGAEAVGAVVMLGGVSVASVAGIAAGVEIGKKMTEVLTPQNSELLRRKALKSLRSKSFLN